MRILKSAVLAFLMSVSANAQIAQPSAGTYPRAVAAGYKAALYCSGIFNAGRAPAQIDANELTGIYPDYDKIVPTLTAQINRVHGAVAVAFDPALPPRYAVWQDGRGCVTLPIGSKAPANSRSAPPPTDCGRRPPPLAARRCRHCCAPFRATGRARRQGVCG